MLESSAVPQAFFFIVRFRGIQVQFPKIELRFDLSKKRDFIQWMQYHKANKGPVESEKRSEST